MGNEIAYEYIPQKPPRKSRRVYRSTTAFGGLSVQGHKGIMEDTLEDMINLSPRGGDTLSTRHPRGRYCTRISYIDSPHGLVSMDDWLFVAEGSAVYRLNDQGQAESCATVSDSDKQMTVFGDQVIILPDKVMVGTVGSGSPMELDTGVLNTVEFLEDKIILPSGTLNWAERGFRVGDGITVSQGTTGSGVPEGQYVIRDMSEKTAYVDRACTDPVSGSARILRSIPNFKQVCVSGNRLYGFVGKDIYVSAVGTPYNWTTVPLEGGQGGAILRDDTEGEFTACIPWQGYMVFFKPGRICKLMGQDSRNYSLVGIDAPGIPAALSRTLCSVGEYLYYHGASGVYRYGGQHPVFLGKLNDTVVNNGMGGTDGLCYYLSLHTGSKTSWRQYVYSPELGAWYIEDDLQPRGMICREGKLFQQDVNGNIWVSTSDGRDTGCSELENKLRGSIPSLADLLPDHAFEPLGYRLTGLYIRATADSGAVMYVRVAYANADAKEDADLYSLAGVLRGKANDRLFHISLPPIFCHGTRIRLEMQGKWDIHAIIREYDPVE